MRNQALVIQFFQTRVSNMKTTHKKHLSAKNRYVHVFQNIQILNVGISRSLKRFDDFRFHPLSPMFAPASLGAAVGAHAGGTPRLAALPVRWPSPKMIPLGF